MLNDALVLNLVYSVLLLLAQAVLVEDQEAVSLQLLRVADVDGLVLRIR